MEKIAIISDIHGNIPALESVLADITKRNINSIFCLGDLAGKGPSGAEVVDRTYLGTKREERMKLFEPTETLNLEADIIGYGDIHGAHVEYFDGKTIFKAGSVGNPMEITQASYAIIEGEYESKDEAPFTISIARIPYDVNKAVMDAAISDMPDKEFYIDELQTAIYRKRRIIAANHS